MHNNDPPSGGEYLVADQMVTVQQVADHIGTNPEAVRTWIRSGMLEAVFFGGAVGYRIQKADLDRFIASRKGAQGLAMARRSGASGFGSERAKNGGPPH